MIYESGLPDKRTINNLSLEVLYHDEWLVAINKPHGLLVHRSKLADDAYEFAVQMLRDQLGQKVYPVHRLDRKTSGVLLFALNEEVNSLMHQQFAANKIDKSYRAIVRGHALDSDTIDYPLLSEKGILQEAITSYKTLARTEVDVPFGKFPTSRYSLVEVIPQSGRMHQIRRQFAHILHPIIGDRPHGCNKQNRLFREHWNMTTMMLHAATLQFEHPVTHQKITIQATLHSEFLRMLKTLNLVLVHKEFIGISYF